jgi:hypothetical protein
MRVKPTKGKKSKIRQLIRSIYGKGRKIAVKTERDAVKTAGRF